MFWAPEISSLVNNKVDSVELEGRRADEYLRRLTMDSKDTVRGKIPNPQRALPFLLILHVSDP